MFRERIEFKDISKMHFVKRKKNQETMPVVVMIDLYKNYIIIGFPEKIVFYDITCDQCAASYTIDDENILDLKVMSDFLLIALYKSSEIHIFSLRIPIPLTSITIQQGVVTNLEISHKDFFITGLENGKIISWDLKTLTKKFTLEFHEDVPGGSIKCIKLTENEEIMVSVGEDNKLCVWNTEDGKRESYRYIEGLEGLYLVKNSYFFCIRNGRVLEYWDLQDIKIINRFDIFSEEYLLMSISLYYAEKNYLFIACAKQIVVINLKSRGIVKEVSTTSENFLVHENIIYFFDDNNKIVCSEIDQSQDSLEISLKKSNKMIMVESKNNLKKIFYFT